VKELVLRDEQSEYGRFSSRESLTPLKAAEGSSDIKSEVV